MTDQPNPDHVETTAIFPQGRDIARGIVAIVSYDYDYGWICEELHEGEYEMTDICDCCGIYCECESTHSDQGRLNALWAAEGIIASRGGKLLHLYEFPQSVADKRRRYKQLSHERT